MEYLHYLSLSTGAVETYFFCRNHVTLTGPLMKCLMGPTLPLTAFFIFISFFFLIDFLSELIHLFVCLFDFFIILLFKIIHIQILSEMASRESKEKDTFRCLRDIIFK